MDEIKLCEKCINYQEYTLWGKLKQIGIILSAIAIISMVIYLSALVFLLYLMK